MPRRSSRGPIQSRITDSAVIDASDALDTPGLDLLPLVVGGAMQQGRLAPVAMGLGMTASFAAIGMLLLAVYHPWLLAFDLLLIVAMAGMFLTGDQTFASLRIVPVAEGLELVSLTQILAWDLPLDAVAEVAPETLRRSVPTIIACTITV